MLFPNVLTVIIGNGNDWSSNRDGPKDQRERVSERECVCERERQSEIDMYVPRINERELVRESVCVRDRQSEIDMKTKVVQHVPRESECECGKRMAYVINVLQFIMM